MKHLREIFLNELAQVYHAEKQIRQALPRMLKGAVSIELHQALKDHLEEAGEQLERLEQVFSILRKPARARRSAGMEGLIAEARAVLAKVEGPGGDAALIAVVQKIEHYELATYGCLCTWAGLMQEQEAARLLKQTMKEEKNCDEHLTGIAETTINGEAAKQSEPLQPRGGRLPKGQGPASSRR